MTNMVFDVRKAIVDRLRATKCKNIEVVIDYMEKHGFFTRYCYTHHHYDGGLADHAWQTYLIAQRIDAERCAKNPRAQRFDDDSLSICAILHDFSKCTGMPEFPMRDHGKRSADMLRALGFKLDTQEFLAVRFHMRMERDRRHFLYDDALRSQLRYVVHTADGKSASLRNGCNDNYAKSMTNPKNK